MRTEAIADFELDAYLDGELELDRRFAVEDYLAGNTEAAMRVMRDLRARTALRLLHARQAPAPADVEPLTEQLGARLMRLSRPGWRTLTRAAAVLVIVALGGTLLVHDDSVHAAPPSYVADAVQAYRTGLLREAMDSQIETTRLDEQEILRSTRIRVPRLPVGWRITDVQLFPSDEGPALQIMLRVPRHRQLSIFAVRAGRVAPASPIAIRRDGASVAYWRRDDISYALIGSARPEELDLIAEGLATDHNAAAT